MLPNGFLLVGASIARLKFQWTISILSIPVVITRAACRPWQSSDKNRRGGVKPVKKKTTALGRWFWFILLLP